jgi:hypothetical protein
MLHFIKTIEDQSFEMALISADKKKVLQTWYQLDGCGQPPCYRLQPTARHISGFKVWNKMYIFIQNRNN